MIVHYYDLYMSLEVYHALGMNVAIAIAIRILVFIIKTLEGTRSSLGIANWHRDDGYLATVLDISSHILLMAS